MTICPKCKEYLAKCKEYSYCCYCGWKYSSDELIEIENGKELPPEKEEKTNEAKNLFSFLDT